MNLYKTPSLFEDCLLTQTLGKGPVNQIRKRISYEINDGHNTGHETR